MTRQHILHLLERLAVICSMLENEKHPGRDQSSHRASDRFFFHLTCTSAVMSFLPSHSVVFVKSLLISNRIDTQPLRWLGLENFCSFSTHIPTAYRCHYTYFRVYAKYTLFAVRSPATDLERRVRPQCFACSWHACPTRLKSLLNSEECKNHTRPKPNGCAPPASQFIFFSFSC